MGTMRGGGPQKKEKKSGDQRFQEWNVCWKAPPNCGRQNTACNVPSNYTKGIKAGDLRPLSSSNLCPPTWLREQELLFQQPLWMIPCLKQTWWWLHVSRHWWCSWICEFDQPNKTLFWNLAIIMSWMITCLWWEFDHKMILLQSSVRCSHTSNTYY
jgi:hypothetical protein